MNERELLETISFPLIINMHFAFQNREYLFLGLDYQKGGDLRYHLSTNKLRINEEQASKNESIIPGFFLACIFMSLFYIHSKNIVHRDVKPENLVFDSAGFLHLTDFGIARIRTSDMSANSSGTPGYMAPEVMSRQNHSFEADYYACGIILYEIMTGRRPYKGRGRKEIREEMMIKEATISRDEVTSKFSDACLDICNQLMKRRPFMRIGYQGKTDMIIQHEWFNDFDWDCIVNKEVKPLFVPTVIISTQSRSWIVFLKELLTKVTIFMTILETKLI